MTEPIISINDLSVYFNKKKALNNVTMDFYPNEITALIGPSGSGKSTLLRSINRMGDLNPEWTLTGAVSYNGHNVYSPRTDTVELRKEIGMVFQQPNPFPMSIYENVVYGLRINGIKDKAVLDKAVEESLKGASIWEEVKDRLHDSALGLSGGNNNVSVLHGFLPRLQRLSFLTNQRLPSTLSPLVRLRKPYITLRTNIPCCSSHVLCNRQAVSHNEQPFSSMENSLSIHQRKTCS